MPFAFLHSLVRSTLPVLITGGQVVCTSGFNPNWMLSWIDRYDPTFFTAVPSIYRSLLQRIAETGWMVKNKSLRFLVTGSDKIDATEVEAVEVAFGVPVIQFYGMSEVSPLPAVRPFPPERMPAGAVGKVNPVWQVTCIDDNGKHLPPGKEGEIIIRGGYFNQLVGVSDEIAQQNIRNGWFHTGDLGYLDEQGFLFYTGRVDNRINRAGKKVQAGAVEEVLLTHQKIEQAAVFGIPDSLYGERIGAVIVLKPGASATSESIREFMARRVADYKVPEYILIQATLPLSQFGKVKRKTLAAHFGLGDGLPKQKSLKSQYVAPRTTIEQQLVAIWTSLFEVESIGIIDNFFALGGHSLLALSLFAEIEEQFGRKLPINTLFDAPTIEKLALLLDREENSEFWDSLVLLKAGGDKTPLFILHDADGDTMLYLNLARRLHPERSVYGLRPYGKEGFPIVHTRIKDIVNHYIDRILTVYPQGPYLLSGLCDGGVYAYEVAQQLQARGHQVALVALLDAIDYQARRRSDAENVRKIYGRPKLLLYRFLLDWGLQLPEFLRNNISVRMVLRLAKEGYIPQNFQGRLVLFRATNDAPGETPQRKKIDDPLFGWQERAIQGLTVYDIVGTHSSMLREPNVKFLAEKMEACIEAAMTGKLDNVANNREKESHLGQKIGTLSVIIPSYNSRQTIGKCLISLLHQKTTETFEVIVVDSSSDGTADFIAQNFPQVQLHRFAERKYAGEARNIGVANAQGEIIAFIDADCRVASYWVEQLMATYQEYQYPVIAGAIDNDNPNNYVGWAYYFCSLNQWMPKLEKCCQDAATGCLSLPRWLFDKCGSFPEGEFCEDTRLSWKLSQAGYPPLFVPSLKVFHTNIESLPVFLKRRISHGKMFAQVRVKEQSFYGLKRLVYLIGSPLIPVILLFRCTNSVLRSRIYQKQFVLSLPLIILGTFAWSWGEFLGYLSSKAQE